MKITIVASSFLPEQGRLERRVDQLARGLVRRGAGVEVLTQGPMQTTVEEPEGVTVRRFGTTLGPVRFALAPRLWERLRTISAESDIVDVHTRHPSLALAVARTGAPRLVVTPAPGIDGLTAWPDARRMRSVINAASLIVCHSEIQRDVLCRAAPRVANRVEVVPDGLDSAALTAASPLQASGRIVLTVDRLEATTSVGRVIAAMPSLDPSFRLVIIGDGPARDRLIAHAADLQVASRVEFVGAVGDELLHRWLRTAEVVVTLPVERGSGSQVMEARAAGASVVASNLPINRWAAARVGTGHVIFVAPKGSPLDVADAIEQAARLAVPSTVGVRSASVPSWESVIDSTWTLYRELIAGRRRSPREDDAAELVSIGAYAERVNGGGH